jgi:hypothetical protein
MCQAGRQPPGSAIHMEILMATETAPISLLSPDESSLLCAAVHSRVDALLELTSCINRRDNSALRAAIVALAREWIGPCSLISPQLVSVLTNDGGRLERSAVWEYTSNPVCAIWHLMDLVQEAALGGLWQRKLESPEAQAWMREFLETLGNEPGYQPGEGGRYCAREKLIAFWCEKLTGDELTDADLRDARKCLAKMTLPTAEELQIARATAIDGIFTGSEAGVRELAAHQTQDDDRAFQPAQQIADRLGFKSLKHFRSYLGAHPEIETRSPRKQRLNIHVGQVMAALARDDREREDREAEAEKALTESASELPRMSRPTSRG